MEFLFKNNLIKTIFTVLIAGLFFFVAWHFILADVSGNPCPGNICNGSVNLDGRTIKYWYTEHVNPAGEFKIRFQAPPSEGGAVRFSVGSFSVRPGGEIIDPPTTEASKIAKYFLANPDPRSEAVALDTVGISSGRVIAAESTFESTPIDFVIKTDLPGAEPGAYELSVSFIEFNQSSEKTITFYIDSAAPLNDEEWRNFNNIIDNPCGDGVDNDLDFVWDCRDIDCDNLVGSEIGGESKFCRYANENVFPGEENNCYDRFDNDFDKDGIDNRDAFDSMFFDYLPESGLDCRDLDCEARAGANDGSLCWYNNNNIQGQGEAKGYPESCRDGFNNDSDNGGGSFTGADSYFTEDYLDCVDLNCWRLGSSADILAEPCPARENFSSAWCIDGADNDFDNGLNSMDKNSSSGADCSDYDCSYLNIYEFDSSEVGSYTGGPEGKTYACAFDESRDEEGNIRAERCFDGIDNDLDLYVWDGSSYVLNSDLEAGIDCADIDCLGIENPDNPGEICFPNEFEIGKYQVCNDIIDNDGDDPDANYIHESSPIGGYDCEDDINDDGETPDCWQMFGNCGPCPDVEDTTYRSCADGADNDLDNNFDCADHADCDGEVGSLFGGGFCTSSGGEAGVMCFDNFDNDAAGGTDCADSGCEGASKISPYGIEQTCGPEDNISRCSDTFDNNRDGNIDCLSSSCAGIAGCAADWAIASCLEVPAYDFPSYGAISNSISVRQYQNARVGNIHRIDIRGAEDYSSLQIKIGSKYDDRFDYPYDFCSGGADSCSISGTGDWNDLQVLFKCDDNTNTTKGYALVQNTDVVGPFELFIECPVPTTPSSEESFLIDIYGNGGAEAGSSERVTRLFEDTPPQVSEIEVGGADDRGVAVVPYGEYLDIRGVPEDPDEGLGSSGICSCEISDFSSLEEPPSYDSSSSGDCRFTLSQIKNDDFYDITIKTTDGADNSSEEGFNDIFTIDVIPIVESQIELRRRDKDGEVYPDEMGGDIFISPYYISEDKMILEGVQFRTADNGSFPGDECLLTIEDDGGNEIYSGSADKEGNGSVVNCNGYYDISSFGLPDDGRYFISVSVADNGNYRIKAPRVPFYVCDSDPILYPDGHVCKKADFDQDGAVEGIQAKYDLYEDEDLVCDNCPNLNNPDQFDFNANGIGDVCEINGFCILDNQPCRDNYDCEQNLCVEGTCAVDSEICEATDECSINYCSTDLGECSGAPMCYVGYCITSDQCTTEDCNCQNITGFCNDDPDKICFSDRNCRNYCDVAAGTCSLTADSCTGDSDCPNPTCIEITVGEDEVINVCSNNNNVSCGEDNDCWPICVHGPGQCSVTTEEDCFVDEDCPADEECLYLQTCSVSGADCYRDEDCPEYPNEVCGPMEGFCDGDSNPCESDEECLENICLDRQCSGSEEVCAFDEDCPGEETCLVRRCSVTGDICSENRPCIPQICKKKIGKCEDSGDPCVVDEDCPLGEECVTDVGFCDISGGYCLIDGDCLAGEDCVKDYGVCEESGSICVDDNNCPLPDEACIDIGYPWLETRFGGIYTRGSVEAAEEAPPSKFNATYCIRAGGDISNFKTRECTQNQANIVDPFNYPGVISQFRTIVGSIDLSGIEAGQYGRVENITSNTEIDDILGGKVYVYRASENEGESLKVDGKIFRNASAIESSGAGLVLVYGNLEIIGNISYEGGTVENLEQLASVGWIVLDDPSTPEKEGNLFIKRTVRKLVGAFYVEDEVHTGQGAQPLTISGLMVARKFSFERFFASRERGSEQIIYDGRAQANTPPGMQDLTKSLPRLQPF